MYQAIKEAPSSLRIVLLSATPMFDKPIEIALTMNLLKLPVEIPKGNKFFKKFIRIKKKGKRILLFKKFRLFQKINKRLCFIERSPTYCISLEK